MIHRANVPPGVWLECGPRYCCVGKARSLSQDVSRIIFIVMYMAKHVW